MKNVNINPLQHVAVLIAVLLSMSLYSHAQEDGGTTGPPADAMAEGRQAGVLDYVYTKLQKDDGGFGWEDQYDGHIAPTFAAVGILYHLGALPKENERLRLIEFIRTHHPQTGVNKEAGPSGAQARNLIYYQIQSLKWLGGDVSEFDSVVMGWKTQAGNLYNYEKGNNPVLTLEMMTPICRSLLGKSLPADMVPYFLERRRSNGSINNAPAMSGGDGNILNTYWGLLGLNLFKHADLKIASTTEWIQSCQVANGGFTWQPNPKIGATDDVAYTWAALKSLEILKGKPKNTKECINYLLSLQNSDGGFGNQPGLPSTPMATYYAFEGLKTLNALPLLKKKVRTTAATPTRLPDLSGLKIYTVQFEAHGSGSPSEAVLLAGKLGIHLWGAKNASPEWVKASQVRADELKVPVTFFHANEEYGKHVTLDGFGSFSHILDPIFPAGGPSKSDRSEVTYTYDEWSANYVQPLLKRNGGVILQIANNEPMARILLDESLKTSGAYAAISTIHFSQNFLFFLPYLNQYRYRLPFIALQDAHGPESWWWMNELSGYRTLFLAKEPTYEGLMKALKNNWVVAVRHDAVSYNKTRMLGGALGVQEFIKARTGEWQWWDTDTHVAPHHNAVITVVSPQDSLEVTNPQRGINIRVRCRWESNRQFLKKPMYKLERLVIEGLEVHPEYIEQKDRRGQIIDSYYLYNLPSPPAKEFLIKAVVRNENTGESETLQTTYGSSL